MTNVEGRRAGRSRALASAPEVGAAPPRPASGFGILRKSVRMKLTAGGSRACLRTPRVIYAPSPDSRVNIHNLTRGRAPRHAARDELYRHDKNRPGPMGCAVGRGETGGRPLQLLAKAIILSLTLF
ncbi:hypothetical protein EVAR_32898_1 [Eumeta japonica]|uniref:Uncharacterized protein n=1 Tax=Eumeta variegata TaxID=151549 RepID=A0A4C1VPK6_EUMVA|nr:hypothetical protein EVAR_32898_1 [Eumeta japonica]